MMTMMAMVMVSYKPPLGIVRLCLFTIPHQMTLVNPFLVLSFYSIVWFICNLIWDYHRIVWPLIGRVMPTRQTRIRSWPYGVERVAFLTKWWPIIGIIIFCTYHICCPPSRQRVQVHSFCVPPVYKFMMKGNKTFKGQRYCEGISPEMQEAI